MAKDKATDFETWPANGGTFVRNKDGSFHRRGAEPVNEPHVATDEERAQAAKVSAEREQPDRVERMQAAPGHGRKPKAPRGK